MKSPAQIEKMLPALDDHVADEFEDQDLDFKQWDTKSMDKSIRLVVHMAVCMANGGGGTRVALNVTGALIGKLPRPGF